jgi:threonine dehydrogenase-like Zn-dependent dehydrogenase
VVCSDIKKHNLELAAIFGATDPIDVAAADIVDEVSARTAGRGVDVTFVAVAGDQVLNAAMQITRRKGRVVGVATFTETSSVGFRSMFYEKELVGTCMYVRQDYDLSIQIAGSKAELLELMITQRISLEELPEMLSELSRGGVESNIKTIVRMKA